MGSKLTIENFNLHRTRKFRRVHGGNVGAHFSLMQCVAACVAVWCRVLPCVALIDGVLQCVAVCCSVLQCVAVCCSVLQRVAVCCSV